MTHLIFSHVLHRRRGSAGIYSLHVYSSLGLRLALCLRQLFGILGSVLESILLVVNFGLMIENGEKDARDGSVYFAR